MAQSKIGGTKAFIHGKVGSEVYYTDHDLEGEIIQVVKSVPDTVRNPRTAAQNRGRIIMATLYKAVGALAQLINHSFEGYAVGRPSLAHFFSVNYDLIKQDIEDHPDTDYQFGLVQWKGGYPRPGAYLVATGPLERVSALRIYLPNARSYVQLRYIAPKSSWTVQYLKKALDLNINDFITVIQIDNQGIISYAKMTYKYTGDISVIIDESIWDDIFYIEGDLPINYNYRQSGSTAFLSLTQNCYGGCLGYVRTKFLDGVPQRSTEYLTVCANVGSSYNEVLATYPKGDKFYY